MRGHPPPLRLRDGRVGVPLEAAPPFGVLPGCEYHVQPLPLAAGDRLIFITDGMLERNTLDIDIGILIEEGPEMHPREAVQQLIRALLEVTGGDLKDDAPCIASTGTAGLHDYAPQTVAPTLPSGKSVPP